MDYEKKYKQLHNLISDLYPFMSEFCKEKVEGFLPELKKSEDEKIRKHLLCLFQNDYGENSSARFAGIKVKDIIAWLEKQGKESNDKVEPKFKVGDYVVNDYCRGKVIALTDDAYLLDTGQGVPFSCEHNVHLWTINDAKSGDVLCYKDEISLYKHDIKNCTKQEPTFGGFVYHCCYDGKRFITDSLYSLTEQDKTDIHPATKEQRDFLFKKMKGAGYEWDAENKELRKIEQKHTETVKWSAQEEYCICELEAMVKEAWRNAENVHNDVTIKKMQELMFFLKTLNPNKKPQPKQEWSEDDKRILDALITSLINKRFAGRLKFLKGIKVSLVIDWLKSLKEKVKKGGSLNNCLL